MNLIYHTESNEWTAYNDSYVTHEQIIDENSVETMELLETSARNSSTPIRPYRRQHHYYVEREIPQIHADQVSEIR